ncbi:hypothetical protein GN244_ATG19662 [Phytophthora infestans]|uniref:Ankyrin repeat protein n=1 Tax=Phytophthora infestans TaxID=4787 RepID=A0A833W3Y1_PHYIN|nr:hypothetical protein GN244_ATG19662 [Phytophthora infestans]KAF4138780.1 hypothetical protein GN958_ATG11989 [Phytophthora infestans]
MTLEEALEVAIATRQVERVDLLLSRFDCTLTPWCKLPPEYCRTATEQSIRHLREATEVVVLVNDDTRKIVDKAVVAAAQNCHLDIAKLLLPSWFHVVQNVLDAGASNGHLCIVMYMVQHAARLGYAGRYS